MPSGNIDYAKAAELADVRKEISDSPEVDLVRSLAGLDDTLKVFTENADELLSVCAKLDDPARAEELTHRQIRDALSEGCRRLHNYLASARALREHCNTFRDHLYETRNSQFCAEWNEKAQDIFTAAAVNSLTGDLRNYTLHYALPIAGVQLKWSRDSGSQSCFYLDTTKLSLWKKWSVKARDYMENKQPLKVSMFVSEYVDLVLAFHEWRKQRQAQIHDGDLRCHQARRAREIALLKELGIDEEFAHPI